MRGFHIPRFNRLWIKNILKKKKKPTQYNNNNNTKKKQDSITTVYIADIVLGIVSNLQMI